MADDDLLARLNALKAPTSAPTAPATASAPPTGPHPSIKPSALSDDITARFRRLASGEGTLSPHRQPQNGGSSSQANLEQVVASLPSERVENAEDEQSLDDLLKELGDDQSSWFNTASEDDRIAVLLQEARAALPALGRSEETEENNGNSAGQAPVSLERDCFAPESEEQVRSLDEQDEKDADDYVTQVMADVELRKKQGIYKDDDSESGEEHNRASASKTASQGTGLPLARSAREPTPLDNLPSAPSTAPVLASISDDDLEARFASLSLPSTPSNKPISRKSPSATAIAKSKLPTFTDEDIESWCVICNEDASIRCLGCEGDLYCQECWTEGHTGPDAGYDEKRHKAVLYNRGEGKEKRERSLAAA